MRFPRPLTGADLLLRLPLVLVCLLSLTLPSRANPIETALECVLSRGDQEIYTKALKMAQRGRWQDAKRLSLQAHNPVLVDYIQWRWLVDPNTRPSFTDIHQFLKQHARWPFQRTLLRKAEKALEKDTEPPITIQWLIAHPPKTGRGLLRLAHALRQTGQKERAYRLARRAWIEKSLSREDEKDFLSLFGHILKTSDHIQRLDNRLWNRDTRAAQRLLNAQKMDPGIVALAKARIALQRRRPPIDRRVRNVPTSYKEDPGLLFDRLVFRRISHGPHEAAELLSHPSADKKKPGLWAPNALF